MAQIFHLRQSESERQAIKQGLDDFFEEHREERLRRAFDRNIKPWDEEWGGPCPYTITEEDKRAAVRNIEPLKHKWRLRVLDQDLDAKDTFALLIITFMFFIVAVFWLA